MLQIEQEHILLYVDVMTTALGLVKPLHFKSGSFLPFSPWSITLRVLIHELQHITGLTCEQIDETITPTMPAH